MNCLDELWRFHAELLAEHHDELIYKTEVENGLLEKRWELPQARQRQDALAAWRLDYEI
jgi:hypothetical protein